MSSSRRAVIVVPAYEPTEKLVELVAELSADGRRILVVDDGSSSRCAATFARAARCPNVVVVAHAENLGKGQALKTAFSRFLAAGTDAVGVVTADADGQHLAADIRRVAERLERDGTALVLGSRTFDRAVPLRSRLGNLLTRGVFRLLIGRALIDTQTGLRGIPRSFLPELLRIEASGYEFELEMLVRATERRMTIDELPIETVYGSFARSHFSPIRDSLRIYFVFVRFVGLSLVSAGIDYAVFAIAYVASRSILGSFVAARSVSSTFNFLANRRLVFRSRGGVPVEAGKYFALVVALTAGSYGLVTIFVRVLGLNVFLGKVLAEGGLFVVSFAVQNLVVFADRERQPAPRLQN